MVKEGREWKRGRKGEREEGGGREGGGREGGGREEGGPCALEGAWEFSGSHHHRYNEGPPSSLALS